MAYGRACKQSRMRQRPTDTDGCYLSNTPLPRRISSCKRVPSASERAMNNLLSRLSPSITNMIRMDHAHVFSAFHQYEVETSPRVKKGLVDNICVALEIHAQLEEEIFYPALRAIAETAAVDKSVPEHDQMRRLIKQLRNLSPGQASYDETFFEL